MRIKIENKLRPFSHQPGTRCLIPYTTWEVEAFPSLLKFRDLASSEKKEVCLQVKGPVKGFTLIQDLEKGRVEVVGRGQAGYFRQQITPEEYPFLKKFDLPKSNMRLSFGVHKKQDWDLVKRRLEMVEVFPFWVRLSKLIPEWTLPQKSVGTMLLLDEVENGSFFQAGFQGILSPRLNDENHLGLIEEREVEGCPLGLLHEGARRILSLFFEQEGSRVHILPRLPKDFHAGRIVSLMTTGGDVLDLEWSKKQIKKVILLPAKDSEVELVLKKGLKSYRIRKSLRQRGERQNASTPLQLKAGQTLYLDRFMV